jgi:putative SAM-dependent methyltransferase
MPAAGRKLNGPNRNLHKSYSGGLTMLCFQLVKTVLDELYKRLPYESDIEKDKAIGMQIGYLRDSYKNLHLGRQINHGDITTRFAYIYTYVTCHANLVYQIIKLSPELEALFDPRSDRRRVKITCIGGGPGSELIGILKYLLKTEKQPKLGFTLYDKEKKWGECWNDVDDKLDLPMEFNSHCEPMDVLDYEDWSSNSKYLESDLFSMIYFLSEIFKKKEAATPFFENLFTNAKSGSLFLFLDNNHIDHYGWFDELIAGHRIEVLKSAQGPDRIHDWGEEKTDLEIYYKKFDPPKLTGQIAWRVCRKS